MSKDFTTVNAMSGTLYYIDDVQVSEEDFGFEQAKEREFESALMEEAEVIENRPTEEACKQAVETLIRFAGADMLDPNCIDTPNRVMKAWRDVWGAGYTMKSEDFLTVFPNEGYDEMIVVKNIPINSTCSHHLAPIHGFAHIAIIPNKELIGLSKFARIADMFARRLQLQERMTVQIADEIEKLLSPIGIAVYIEAAHMCMSTRGVKIHDSVTVTTALRGAFKNNPDTRAEFMAICKG